MTTHTPPCLWFDCQAEEAAQFIRRFFSTRASMGFCA